MAQINVVPYIDVSLVLLVIFMITAPLLTRGVRVHLPRAAAQPLPQNKRQRQPVVLTVKSDGSLYLNIGEHPDKPVAPALVVALVEVVLKAHPRTPVLVRGAARARYAAVVRGMSLLQAAGAENVGLITRNPKEPLVRKPGR